MRWLVNMHNPRLPDHWMTVAAYFHETPQEAIAREARYLEGKVIGEPKATDTYTVEQLTAMGTVGIYEPEREKGKGGDG